MILHSIAVFVLHWGILANFGNFRSRFLCTLGTVKINKSEAGIMDGNNVIYRNRSRPVKREHLV
jgi:hypothetical protein